MDLNNFLNDFENTLDNRGKIEEEKEDIFDDIVKNLLSYLNKDNLDEITHKIKKRSEFENVTIKIGDYIHSHTLSECKELLTPEKCLKLIGKNKKLYQEVDMYKISNFYNVPTIDSFLQELVAKKNVASISIDISRYNTASLLNPDPYLSQAQQQLQQMQYKWLTSTPNSSEPFTTLQNYSIDPNGVSNIWHQQNLNKWLEPMGNNPMSEPNFNWLNNKKPNLNLALSVNTDNTGRWYRIGNEDKVFNSLAELEEYEDKERNKSVWEKLKEKWFGEC